MSAEAVASASHTRYFPLRQLADYLQPKEPVISSIGILGQGKTSAAVVPARWVTEGKPPKHELRPVVVYVACICIGYNLVSVYACL